MQEPYGEGVATHTGPESCGYLRKGVPADRLELLGQRDHLILERQVAGLSEGLDPAAQGPVTDAELLGGLMVGGAALDDERGGLELELLAVAFLSRTLVCHRWP